MSTYNVYIGEYLIMENVPGQDVKDKMEHVRAFFNYYPDDENRKEDIRIVKNSWLYNITLWTKWFDRGILNNVITTCYGKRIYSKGKCPQN